MAEAGQILSGAELAKFCIMIKNTSSYRDTLEIQNSNWEYDIVELGYKYNMTDIAASFGLWQLNRLSKWQERRRNQLI